MPPHPCTQEGPLVAKRIDVNHRNVYYGDFLAAEDVTMVIEPRSFTTLIEPSGSGKSTSLCTLTRLHGVLPVVVRRQVGMAIQRPNPFPTMSIQENVLAGIRLNNRRISKDAAAEVVETSLRGANLWEEVKDRLDKPGSSLSGGQQQRLCIARAIAVKPSVVLMDEPCSALDPISTLAIEDLIAELKDEYTIVIVTHNMQQAARVSDKTGFFNIAGSGQPGRLVEVDDTAKMFSTPSEKSTEDYISGRFG